MPPLVDTEFSAMIGGGNGIAPSKVAQDFIEAMEKDIYEIRVVPSAASETRSPELPKSRYFM